MTTTKKKSKAVIAGEIHYLECQDENCEWAPCVDRRMAQNHEMKLKARIKSLEGTLKVAFSGLQWGCNAFWPDKESLMRDALHKVSEALSEVKDVDGS